MHANVLGTRKDENEEQLQQQRHVHAYHVQPVGARDREETADHQYATASCAGVGRVHRLRSPVLLCSTETTASRKVQSVLCVERVAVVSTTAHDCGG
eukprot:scaffold54797_cov60-Phaeocystis_antarctica.AAC.5